MNEHGLCYEWALNYTLFEHNKAYISSGTSGITEGTSHGIKYSQLQSDNHGNMLTLALYSGAHTADIGGGFVDVFICQNCTLKMIIKFSKLQLNLS